VKFTLFAALLISTGTAFAQSAGKTDVTEAFRSSPQEIAAQMDDVATCSLRQNYFEALAFIEQADFGIKRGQLESLWSAASKGCMENGKAIDFQAFSDALHKRRAAAVAECLNKASSTEFTAMRDRFWAFNKNDAAMYHMGMKGDWNSQSLVACDPSIKKMGKPYNDNRFDLMAYFWKLPGSPIKAVDTAKGVN
jgi:hypothetical protein